MIGPAVQTEKCGTALLGTSFECFYGNVAIADVEAEMPEVRSEVGPYCRCGCVVHLGQAKPKRLLATSSQSCPGRTFWLIQADMDHTIRFKVERFRLPCNTRQWLKVRDGSSLSANLIADLSGDPLRLDVVNSTGSNLLLEFYSDEVNGVSGGICGGGFLAHATQIRSRRRNTTVILPLASQSIGLVPALILKLTAVHVAAIFFLSFLLIATALLGAQYLFRYRKYHVAKAEDHDSMSLTTGGEVSRTHSAASLNETRTRAVSSATLLSEVISLKRLRVNGRNKHSKLRESLDCDTITLAKEETMSVCSTVTLTQKDSTSEEPKTLPTSPEKSEKDDETSGSGKRKIFTLRRSSNISSNNGGPPLTHVRASTSTENASKSDPGFYSPASSLASTATIRSTNAKETKDKRNNRAKLLAGPGSDFSIVGADLEMDYYDYNVVNAGAAPGSYLGMDPAFLVWIPPIDSEEMESHELEDIKPKVYIDPGSNKESPEDEEQVSLLSKSKIVTVVEVEKRPLLSGRPVKTKSEGDDEKETKVEKISSMDDNDDIKYADEDDETECNTELSYQDSNILASS